MGLFLDPLDARQEGEHWRLLRHVQYRTAGRTYTVPRGFVTDGASIPRCLWTLVGHPMGTYAEAAVLHDWLYREAPESRAKADGLLLEATKALGVRWSQRWALYLGVRLGGWVAWAAHRINDPEPPAGPTVCPV